MKRYYLFMFVTLLLGAVTSSAFMQTSAQDINCNLLSAEDCSLYSGTLSNQFSSATHPVLNIRTSTGEFGFDFEGEGSSFFENGLPVALDWRFEERADIIAVDNVVYWRDAGQEIWLRSEDTNDAIRLIESTTNALYVAAMERGEDTEFNGQAMAVFTGDVDVATFLGNAVYIEMLAGIGGVDPAVVETSLPLLVPMMEPAIVQATAWVGQDDNLLYYMRIFLDIGATIPEPISYVGDVRFSLEIEMQFTEHDQGVQIEAPTENIEDATEDFFLLGDSMSEFVNNGAIPPEGEIMAGESLTLTAGVTQDGRVFRLNASAGDVVTITAMALDTESGFDPILYIYSADALLGNNDDYEGDDSSLGQFDAQIVSLEIPEDGAYDVLVQWYAIEEAADFELSIVVE